MISLSLRALVFAALLCGALTGCAAKFTTHQRTALASANRIGYRTVADPLFVEIVKELTADSVIKWDASRLAYLPAEAQSDPTGWTLAEFSRRGPFADAAVLPWKPLNPWHPAFAATWPGGDSTTINVWKLPAYPDTFAYANTLIHERTHSFCLIHPLSQYRAENICDPGYVIGDLTEAIARYRATGSGNDPAKTRLCPGLCQALRRRGLVTECEEEQTETKTGKATGEVFSRCPRCSGSR